MSEGEQTISAMAELISSGLEMLSEQVGKLEKRLDDYCIQLNKLQDNIVKKVDRNTVIELIDEMVFVTSNCVHNKHKRPNL